MGDQRLGWDEGTSERKSMRDQRLGWDEGTSGERVWGTRGWVGMRVQVERESMRDQRLGWDEGTSGERECEGPEVGVG